MTATTDTLDLVRRWAAAEQQNDPGLLDGVLADDFQGVGPAGFVLTREQWLARFGNGLENRAFAVEDAQVREYGAASVAIGALAQETSFQGRDNSGRVGGLPRSFQIGMSSKWTVLPVLARPRRWVRGTSRPCSNGCLAVSSRAAWLALAPSRRLARALMPGPVGVPRAVDGATSMTGLRPIRLVFPAFSKLRTTARSPSTAMLTGVPTGRPSRR